MSKMKRAAARAAARACVSAGLLLAGAAGRADVIVNDPFTDGSRSNATGGDPQGLVYYSSSATAGCTAPAKPRIGPDSFRHSHS